MNKIFISHRHSDKEMARKIQSSLESFGFTVWIDDKDVMGGDQIFKKVIAGIQESDVVIALLSKESVNSNWVDRELSRALFHETDDKSCFVIPVRLDDCEVPFDVKDKKHIDLFKNYDFYMREVVRKIDDHLGVSWSYDETPQYAEENLIYNLKLNRNYSTLCIDNGLAFFYTENYAHISPKEINIRIPDWAKEIISKDLRNPTQEELEQTIPFKFGAATEYLKNRNTEAVDGFFNCKVGIIKIEKPVQRFGLPLTLTVIPLSYWVVKEFNRRILRNPEDAALQKIKNDNLLELTQVSNDVVFNCPSALYVELAIITQDKQVCIVEKNPQLSVLAHSSRSKWTATIEEGFEWNKDIDIENMKLRVDSVIARCFHLELDLFNELFQDVKLTGIALEYTHLNTALIGFCSTSIYSAELARKIKLSEDFQLKYRFVPVESINDEFFENQADNVTWHPTARLRLHAVKKWVASLATDGGTN